ncbi:MAG: hypothetical protein NC115_05370 [Bacteroidales bacterium]|nr:hypothetical protein [Bacteroidales bacterium]
MVNFKQCSLCQNRAFDKNVGLLCGKTGAKPSFEDGACGDYQPDHSEVRRQLEKEANELKSKKEIGGFLAFFLFGVIGGGMMLSVMTLFFTPGMLYGILYCALFLLIGVKTIFAFIRLKPNAMALAYTYCAMMLVDDITVGVIDFWSGIVISRLVWIVICVSFLTFSEDLKYKFPKEERTWKWLEKIVLLVQIVLSAAVIVLYSV